MTIEKPRSSRSGVQSSFSQPRSEVTGDVEASGEAIRIVGESQRRGSRHAEGAWIHNRADEDAADRAGAGRRLVGGLVQQLKREVEARNRIPVRAGADDQAFRIGRQRTGPDRGEYSPPAAAPMQLGVADLRIER